MTNLATRLLAWTALAVFPSSLVYTEVAGGDRRATSGWSLSWSDEFNAPDGSTPDLKKWTYDVGGNGWGNHELESYTSRPENAKIVGANLVITARREQHTSADGITQPYTSARL